LAFAVDPGNVNTVFMGGQAVAVSGEWNGAIYRGTVTSTGSGSSLAYAMTTSFVGEGTHSDVHSLVFEGSSTVWACTDGGVFKTTTAAGTPAFTSFNLGLNTMSANYLAQHPTEPAVMLCGFQDNGTGRYTGEECWTHVQRGDGGYPVINWHTPRKVLVYANGSVLRATDGGRDYGSWTDVTPPGAQWGMMAQPLVSTPQSTTTADAEVVAYAAVYQTSSSSPYYTGIWISEDFGSTWALLGTNIFPSRIYAMAFANGTRLFAASNSGHVFRIQKTGSPWGGGTIQAGLPAGWITDIGIDWDDAARNSIYITRGGIGDYRHVWHYNGTAWSAKSGPSASAATSLLDIEHNAIVVDPNSTQTVYAAADIGVWVSTDRGANWNTFERGLPDAAVLDLQIHKQGRLLRAALHGRGVYETRMDLPASPDVELYVRDTTFDVGHSPTADGLDDEAQPTWAPTMHWESPNIKVDVPTPSGYQTGHNIDFFQFNDVLVDGSGGVATIAPPQIVKNRVHVEVHNRGVVDATNVRVMLMVADAAVGLTLPTGYTSSVTGGTAINNAVWKTVGFRTIGTLKVGFPQVVEFELRSDMHLPAPASLPGHDHFCLLAIVHSSADPFTSTQTNADFLTVDDRKVAQKNLHIVQFVGIPPPVSSTGMWGQWRVAGRGGHTELVLDLGGFKGRLGLLAPPGFFKGVKLDAFKVDRTDRVKRWADKHTAQLKRWADGGKEGPGKSDETPPFQPAKIKEMIDAIDAVRDQPLVMVEATRGPVVLRGFKLPANSTFKGFLNFEAAPSMKPGESYDIRVAMRPGIPTKEGASGAATRETVWGATTPGGGSTYRVQVVPKP
jgi:hypothetical protein